MVGKDYSPYKVVNDIVELLLECSHKYKQVQYMDVVVIYLEFSHT